MTQLNLFTLTSDASKRKTGFRHRWHIRKNGEHIALAVPGEKTVHIHPGKYQDAVPYDRFDMTYADYDVWMKDNQFEEVE